MKRKGIWIAGWLVSSLLILNGCQKAAEDTNSAGPAATTKVASDSIDTAAIEAELKRIENDWPRVIKEKDVETLKRVEADDGVFIYRDGSLGDKSTDLKDVESGALSADSWEIMDLKVTVLNKDAAIVSGRGAVKNGKYKLLDGKSLDISGQYRFLDTFARRNGEWKLVGGAAVPMTPEAAASPSAAPKASPALAASPAVAAPPAVRTPPVRTATPAVRPTVRRTPSPPVPPAPTP